MNEPNQEQTRRSKFAPVAAGDRFAHYEIQSKLGAGGMGDVYLAKDNVLGRNVALKFLPPHLSEDESFRSRFMREARAAASLNHPNIITIYEIAEAGDLVYLAMEQVVGESLAELLGRERPETAQTLDIIVQVCSALKAAHENSIVHRDIKPDNIMITRSGLVKVLDFGLAKTEDEKELTQAGTTLGTASYMSPEQGEGRDVDYRSDIFSVGIVLYEMLSGAKAFVRDYLPATIYAIIHEELPPLSDQRPELGEEYQRIVDLALHKSPDSRYQDLSAMIDDINALRGQSQIVPALRTSSHSAAPRARSLAALCLNNLGSADDDFLCYGITEDLIVDLTRLGEIRVAPMRSVLKYRNSDDDLSEIAKRLDVDYILDGSLMKTSGRIRVSAQLIDTASGKNLWADRWESAEAEIPQIKVELARGVGSALDIETVTDGSSPIVAQPADNAQAYECYLRANYVFDRKKEHTDIEVARGLYEQALAADPSMTLAEIGIARILLHRGKFTEAIERLREPLKKARAAERTVDAFKLQLVICNACIRLSSWDEARIAGREALSLAKELGDHAGELEALRSLIDIHQHRAEFDKALYLFERVMEILRYLDDQDTVAETYKSIGAVHFRKGEYDRARTLFNEAITIARRRGDLVLEAKCVSNNGLTYANVGNLTEALTCFKRALEIYEKVDYPSGKANAYNNLALIHVTTGNYQQALDDAQRGADIVKDLKDTGAYALAMSNVARYQAILGRYDTAIETAEEALKAGHRLDYPFVVNLANDSLGYCWLCRGDLKKARGYYSEALEVANQAGLKREAGLAHSNLAEVSYYLGDLDQARASAQLALDVSAEFGGILAKIRGQAYLGVARALTGGATEGLALLDGSLQEARTLGDPRYIITILRLICAARRSSTDKDDATAADTLAEAAELADKYKIAHEIRLCREMREV